MAKMRVEIISENGRQWKKYPTDGNKIIINRGSKGRGNVEYAPTFTKNSIITYRAGIFPFRGLRQKVILMKDAGACVDFAFLKDRVNVYIPTVTRAQIIQMFKAEVLKAAGTLTNKLQVPMALYILAMVPIMLGVIQLLVMTGRLRI